MLQLVRLVYYKSQLHLILSTLNELSLTLVLRKIVLVTLAFSCLILNLMFKCSGMNPLMGV